MSYQFKHYSTGGGGANKLPQILNKTVTSITADDMEGATSITRYMFEYCNSLTSVTIPESVTSIGINAFYNCKWLTEINYNATSCDDLAANNHIFTYGGQIEEGITINIGANVKKYLLICSTLIVTNLTRLK